MKLAHVALENMLVFDEDRMISWLIEDSQTYYRFVQKLSCQAQGEIGNFVLSDKEKTIKIDSEVQMIKGPFDISLNSKKISTMISKKLIKQAAESGNMQKFNTLLNMANEYFLELVKELDLPVEVEELQEDVLFKAVSVKTSEGHLFYENLVNYIALVLNLFRPKLLILVDILPYIDGDKLEEFIQFLLYEDVKVLFVDFFNKDNMGSHFKTYFLDIDNCEFEYQKGKFAYK